MNFIQDYALLVAIALPVLIIVGINLFLVMGGERGTLLVPSFGPFEKGLEPAPEQPQVAVREETQAANDEFARKAA
jgi:hypothetical protein